MAYHELIKNFEKIRDYMRQFYVYGFKGRSQYDGKSLRSYDNERRRMESWLGDDMSFRQEADGKKVFLSVDSRSIVENPLYQAFKAKSFTSGDITFHFYILDLLSDNQAYSVQEIVTLLSQRYLSHFPEDHSLDESSLRKKLREYEKLGLLTVEKQGRQLYYRRNVDSVPLAQWQEALSFFTEENPLGVIGSYMKTEESPHPFGFKHHYMLCCLDSQIIYDVLEGISQNCLVELSIFSQRFTGKERQYTVYPYKIYISVQSGRQYLLCYHLSYGRPYLFRLDSIRKVTRKDYEANHSTYKGYCEKFSQNLWGVSASNDPTLEHLEMTLYIGPGEGFILQRLEREKRCGHIVSVDNRHYRFVADVYDATELIPWLRSFIGRITSLTCSNPYVTKTFYQDLEAMEALYGGDDHAVS